MDSGSFFGTIVASLGGSMLKGSFNLNLGMLCVAIALVVSPVGMLSSICSCDVGDIFLVCPSLFVG